MLALIMAGGVGSRLALGEKPLILIRGRPMLSYVHDACGGAGTDPVIVCSPKTPMTRNWCRANGIDHFPARGAGYVEDMIEACTSLDATGMILVCASDLPCIDNNILLQILEMSASAGTDACSVWVPASLTNPDERSMLYREQVNGVCACPTGVNTLDGEGIAMAQEETRILIEDLRLAINVNTVEDRMRAETFLRSHPVSRSSPANGEL
jgi:adenosylcobinamide-phosphate guanylyltransferase